MLMRLLQLRGGEGGAPKGGSWLPGEISHAIRGSELSAPLPDFQGGKRGA